MILFSPTYFVKLTTYLVISFVKRYFHEIFGKIAAIFTLQYGNHRISYHQIYRKIKFSEPLKLLELQFRHYVSVQIGFT